MSDPHELARFILAKMREGWVIFQIWFQAEYGRTVTEEEMLAALRVIPEVFDE